MFRPPRQRDPAPDRPDPAHGGRTLDYRNPNEDAPRDGGEDDQEGFLDVKANLRALRELAIKVPLGILVEGVITLLGGAAVAFLLLALIRGCT